MNFMFGFVLGMTLVGFVGLFNIKWLGADSIKEVLEAIFWLILLLALIALFIEKFIFLYVMFGVIVGVILGFVKVRVD